jgi:uncharacterized cofD-like protein
VSSFDVVVLGGGGGGSTFLQSAHEHHPDVRMLAVVGTADSGGSSGKLRNKYPGMVPPGDLMKCLAATTSDPAFSKEALLVRNENGDSKGNLLFVELFKEWGNAIAVHKLKEKLGSATPVLTLTDGPTDLVARYSGHEVQGEIHTVELTIDPSVDAWDARMSCELYIAGTKEEAVVSDKARQALLEAQSVVIAPMHTLATGLPLFRPLVGLSDTEKQVIGAKMTMVLGSENPRSLKGFTAADHIRIVTAISGIHPAKIALSMRGHIDIGNLPADVELVDIGEVVHNHNIDASDPLAHDKPATRHHDTYASPVITQPRGRTIQ